jgi:HD-GYP domain-containing protein (c-di-GMP phosphodiesterase class II)
MDAATDTIGRSYKKGKSLEQFIEELHRGSGTCYAPWLCQLLSGKAVQEDIQYLLTKGRRQNYRDTYLLLRDVEQSGG